MIIYSLASETATVREMPDIAVLRKPLPGTQATHRIGPQLVSLEQQFLKCGLWTSRISITWALIRNVNTQVHPDLMNPKLRRWARH